MEGHDRARSGCASLIERARDALADLRAETVTCYQAGHFAAEPFVRAGNVLAELNAVLARGTEGVMDPKDSLDYSKVGALRLMTERALDDLKQAEYAVNALRLDGGQDDAALDAAARVLLRRAHSKIAGPEGVASCRLWAELLAPKGAEE